MDLVHRRPCPTLRFLFRDAALFVPFLDMLGLSFLFAGVTALVSAWHVEPPGSPKRRGSAALARPARIEMSNRNAMGDLSRVMLNP
jgi:hypothetical protein